MPWWVCLLVVLAALAGGGWCGYLLAVQRAARIVAAMTGTELAKFTTRVADLRKPTP